MNRKNRILIGRTLAISLISTVFSAVEAKQPTGFVVGGHFGVGQTKLDSNYKLPNQKDVDESTDGELDNLSKGSLASILTTEIDGLSKDALAKVTISHLNTLSDVELKDMAKDLGATDEDLDGKSKADLIAAATTLINDASQADVATALKEDINALSKSELETFAQNSKSSLTTATQEKLFGKIVLKSGANIKFDGKKTQLVGDVLFGYQGYIDKVFTAFNISYDFIPLKITDRIDSGNIQVAKRGGSFDLDLYVGTDLSKDTTVFGILGANFSVWKLDLKQRSGNVFNKKTRLGTELIPSLVLGVGHRMMLDNNLALQTIAKGYIGKKTKVGNGLARIKASSAVFKVGLIYYLDL